MAHETTFKQKRDARLSPQHPSTRPHGQVRGPAIALTKDKLLPFNVSVGSQPCRTFGLHPELPVLHSLYHSGEAAFVANVGALVSPVTKVSQPVSQSLPHS